MIRQFILNGIVSGSIYALIAVSFALIYRTVKFFHFAHGVVYAAGPYLAYGFVLSLGVYHALSFFLPRFWRGGLA